MTTEPILITNDLGYTTDSINETLTYGDIAQVPTTEDSNPYEDLGLDADTEELDEGTPEDVHYKTNPSYVTFKFFDTPLTASDDQEDISYTEYEEAIAQAHAETLSQPEEDPEDTVSGPTTIKTNWFDKVRDYGVPITFTVPKNITLDIPGVANIRFDSTAPKDKIKNIILAVLDAQE